MFMGDNNCCIMCAVCPGDSCCVSREDTSCFVSGGIILVVYSEVITRVICVFGEECCAMVSCCFLLVSIGCLFNWKIRHGLVVYMTFYTTFNEDSISQQLCTFIKFSGLRTDRS